MLNIQNFYQDPYRQNSIVFQMFGIYICGIRNAIIIGKFNRVYKKWIQFNLFGRCVKWKFPQLKC